MSRVDAQQLSRGSIHPGEGKKQERNQKQKRESQVDLLWRAVCLFFNLRRAGSPWEITRLWRRRPQPRVRFLARKLVELVAMYVFIDALTVAPRPDRSLIAAEKQTLWRFSNLTTDDVVFRVTFTLGYHIMSFVAGRFNVTVWAFVTVLLGLSDPEAWPHFNGPAGSFYTVRGFWGSVQLARPEIDI
jgi:hypothetical protein